MKPSKATHAFTSKRALIDKANTTTLIAAGVAAFLVVFSLVASKTLLSQAMYQNRVISQKKTTLKTIQANLDARDDLVNAYGAFTKTPQNIIGGNPAGSGDRDGDNAKIVLDALPSKYDFPALTASLEKMAEAEGMRISNITGTDDQVAQSDQASATPKPVPMSFVVSVDGGYSQLESLVSAYERSIRPIEVQIMSVTGGEGGVKGVITAQTYYQPEKLLELTTKAVK